MVKYPQRMEREENEGYTDWVDCSQEVHRIACCDCGLVHDFQFQEIDGRIHFRARRNNRATGQKRRQQVRRNAREAASRVLHDPMNSKKAKLAAGKSMSQKG